MSDFVLILYSREGCCLCKGLEQRLRDIPLHDLTPSLELRVLDIDGDGIPCEVRSSYDLKVPVLSLLIAKLNKTVEFPRVSPRLDSKGLFQWLQKVLTKSI